MKRNTLNFEKVLKVSAWLKENQGAFTDKDSFVSIAREVSAAMGFEVSTPTLTKLFKANGLSFPKKIRADVKVSREEFEQLKLDVGIIAALLSERFTVFGATPCNTLRQIGEKYVK